MILKILEKGSTKVYAPDDQVADYLFLGFTDTGTTTEVVVTDPSKEIVEMKIEDDIVTAFRYKGDPVWRTVAGGSGGTDTYKVKVDGTDTADYLENKLQQGTNITITKSGGKLVVSSTGGSGGSSSLLDPVTDLAALKAINTTTFTTVKEIQVETLGKYKFQAASTLVGDDVNVITPTVGTGRWIKQSIDIAEVASNTGHIWTDKTEEPRLKNKKIKLVNGDGLEKKILAIGSSVMLGYTAASYLVIGKSYTIASQGDTNWTAVGAASNNAGTVFTATATGIGTGVAKLNTAYPEQLVTKLNTNDAGWTLLNNSIAGHSSNNIYYRLWKDGLKNNPSVVLIGACPNNDGLDSTTTLENVANALENYEKGMDKIIKGCKENGIEWYVVGIYPKVGYTALPYNAAKKLNIALNRKYGAKYINVYNMLDDGTGAIKTAYHSGDGIHLNEAGCKVITGAFPSNLLERDRLFEAGVTYNSGSGLLLGADTTTAKPLESTTVQSTNTEAHTFGFDFKPPATVIPCVLASEVTTREMNINIDANGYIGLFYETTQVITTTTKPNKYWNRVRLTFARDTNYFKLYMNKTLLGTSGYQGQYFGAFSIGGGLTAANNAVGTEFRNVCHWSCELSADEIEEDYNNDILKSCLSYFNPLNSKPLTCFESYGVTSQRRLLVNSASFTLVSSDLENNFTDAEKTKLSTINTVGTAVASATSITAPSAIFHVTGTTAISTITVPYTGFTGMITIIPDGIFTLATGGNIAEAYTAVVGRAIQLIFDGTTWYRVNS